MRKSSPKCASNLLWKDFAELYVFSLEWKCDRKKTAIRWRWRRWSDMYIKRWIRRLVTMRLTKWIMKLIQKTRWCKSESVISKKHVDGRGRVTTDEEQWVEKRSTLYQLTVSRRAQLVALCSVKNWEKEKILTWFFHYTFVQCSLTDSLFFC